MSVFKRNEYWLQLPDGRALYYFQAPDPAQAAAKAAEIAALNDITNWTLGRDEKAVYSCKFSFQKKQVLRCTQTTNRKEAEKFEQTLKNQEKKGMLGRVLEQISLRTPVRAIQMKDIIKAFEKFAEHERMAARTARGYKCAFGILVRGAMGKDVDLDSVAVSDLTPLLVYNYKESVIQECKGVSQAKKRSLEASANAALRQTKAFFSSHALVHYRQINNLEMPANVKDFLRSPGFKDGAKREYKTPPPAVIAASRASLDEQREKDPGIYLAIWLALGFGLRKSEVSAVKAGWFRVGPGGVELELKATCVPGRTTEKDSMKNDDRNPTIQCANGAWKHLAPFISKLGPEDYVIPGKTATHRCLLVFRRISEWMRSLGWNTAKCMHEWRAFAGCKVAERDGIEAASIWMRHSSILITQRNYGRYLRTRVTDLDLDIPGYAPAATQPSNITSAAQVSCSVSPSA